MLLQILFLLSFSIVAQADCRTVDDRDKRPFDELSPIVIDIDNDGKPDRILPRVLKLKPTLQRHGPKRTREKESHWIVFDLHTSKGRNLKSFFRYQYGSDWANYWVYALVPCDVNGDGKTDLVFYSGDDESDDTIILLNKNGRFVVHSKKHSEGNPSANAAKPAFPSLA
ncbi:MAG TPA: hypothetical protein DHU55_13440 [Blastocatellia bacterium]|jgi:hypothetical protein|nr:hypothetical protein [Blastocatellia bacterium]HAF23955.1 hypothetical protein [Blastocatellia bacterium]HCX30751.1 hypothetical protein [Blastocatellia bacterium]